MPRRRGIAERVRKTLDCAFAERELYIRKDGAVRFVRLKRHVQVAFTTAGIALATGIGTALVSILVLNHSVDQRDRTIAEMAAAFDQLRTEMVRNGTRLSEFAKELQEKQEQLSRVIEQRQSLNDSLNAATVELQRVAEQQESTEEANTSLRGRLIRLDRRVDSALVDKPSAPIEEKIEAVISERDDSVEEQRRMATTIGSLERRLEALSRVEARFEGLLQERNDAIARSERMADQVAQLEQRLTRLRSSQDELVARVQERTQSDLGEIEAAIALTGLDATSLLGEDEDAPAALGGPLIALPGGAGDASLESIDAGFQLSMEHLEAHLSRWAGIQGLLARLPLTSPLDAYYVSSPFGKRRDPMTKRWAMHYGIDFAGPPRSPVLSTAPGTVVFVGHKGPYGKLVEIDHGYGITTRYGHLHTILVKSGQTVDYRHKIGVMGNTGRSTGAHVHYEILYDGQPQDPAKFLKAGRYIFKS